MTTPRIVPRHVPVDLATCPPMHVFLMSISGPSHVRLRTHFVSTYRVTYVYSCPGSPIHIRIYLPRPMSTHARPHARALATHVRHMTNRVRV